MLLAIGLSAALASMLCAGKALYTRTRRLKKERQYFKWRNRQAQIDYDNLPEEVKPQFQINKDSKWHYLEKL